MKDKIIAKRYANSFLESTTEADLDNNFDDFIAFVSAYAMDEQLQYILCHPEIPLVKKVATIKKLFGEKGEKIACNFICLLVKRQRINYIKKIKHEVTVLYRKRKGIRDIVVKSAVKLSDDERKKLKSILEQKFGLLEITEEVDPSIIGGLVICFEDQVLDESIRYRLKKLKELMLRIDNEWLASLIDQPGLAI